MLEAAKAIDNFAVGRPTRSSTRTWRRGSTAPTAPSRCERLVICGASRTGTRRRCRWPEDCHVDFAPAGRRFVCAAPGLQLAIDVRVRRSRVLCRQARRGRRDQPPAPGARRPAAAHRKQIEANLHWCLHGVGPPEPESPVEACASPSNPLLPKPRPRRPSPRCSTGTADRTTSSCSWMRCERRRCSRPRSTLWQNAPGVHNNNPTSYGDDVRAASASVNFGVWARFAYALNARSTYVCVFDDDTIPGSAWSRTALRPWPSARRYWAPSVSSTAIHVRRRRPSARTTRPRSRSAGTTRQP